MTTIIHEGRSYEPRAFVEKTLSELVDEVGGKKEFLAAVEHCERMTQKARWHALWRAISENVLAAAGETACIVAIHIGAMFLASPWLDLRVHVSDAPWILSLVGAILAIFLVVEVSWVKGWVTTWLMMSGPTVEPQDVQERAVTAAQAFYGNLTWRLSLLGTACYPITFAAILWGLGAPSLAYYVFIPCTFFMGASGNILYLMRLFHSDLLGWFRLEGIEFTSEQYEAIFKARSGLGPYRRFRAWLDRNGYGDVQPTELYAKCQAIVGIPAILVVLGELCQIGDVRVRWLVAAILAVGLVLVVLSNFVRFLLLSWRPVRTPDQTESESPVPLTETALKSQTRAFRRMIP